MTVLISCGAPDDVDKSQCDARCYNAKRARCACVCLGENHGVGYEQAVDNTREHHEEWVKHARANGQVIATVELALAVLQEPLFPLSEVAA